MLRIRDVYPGSRILIFYPSRIQKQQQKRGVKKIICCHTFLCNNKFHKNENYFIFEMLKKKIWANFQRNIALLFLPKKLSLSYQIYGFGIRDPRSGIRDPGSEIRDPRSEIRDPGSGIRDPIRKKPIPDPGSRGQKGTGSRIRNPALSYLAASEVKVAVSLAYTKSQRGRRASPSPEARPFTAATSSLGNPARHNTSRSTPSQKCTKS